MNRDNNNNDDSGLSTCVCGYKNKRYFGSNCTMGCYYRSEA